VGATTMIFSIILGLTEGLRPELVTNLSILYPPFLLGLMAGGDRVEGLASRPSAPLTRGKLVDAIRVNCIWVEPRPSLRVKRSNPGPRMTPWIASSLRFSQ